MHAHHTRTQISASEPVRMPLIRDRTAASHEYASANARRFQGVTVHDLDQDEVVLDGVANAIAVLARKIAIAPQMTNYIGGRPSRAELIEQICDLADDALGGEAGRLVRAQARIDGER